MTDISVKVFIPFRDRGTDPRRAANLGIVMNWWWLQGYEPLVVSDGLEGDAPFNRHRAYNRAISGNPEQPNYIFSEADMLIPDEQVMQAANLALSAPGLVVPFTQYRYLSDPSTGGVRKAFDETETPELAGMIERGYPFDVFPESTMDDGKSIGAVNVVSAATLEITGGFTEATHGNWYDDNIIEEGFAFLTGAKTRFVEGPAVHLYHLPGWKGDHLTPEDKAATRRNRDLLINMRADVIQGNADKVRSLLAFRGER